MPRRRPLSLQAIDLALLDAGRCRRAMVELLRTAPIGGPEHQAAGAVTAALDGLAEALTGDRTLWHGRPVPCPMPARLDGG